MSTGDDIEQARPPIRRRKPGRIGIWPVMWAVLASLLVWVVFLSASGRTVTLPGWIVDRVEARMSAALPEGGVALDRMELTIGAEGRPRVVFADVEISDGGGRSVARLNELSASLSPARLLEGAVVPAELRLSGAQITIRRSSDGAFALSFGAAGDVEAESLGSVIDAVDTAFSSGALGDLRTIEATDLTIALEDARSGRIWQATGGHLILSNRPDAVSVTITSEVFNGTEDLADVQLSFRTEKGGLTSSVGVTFANAAARDLALQSPALSYLALLDAPISGSMRTTIANDGALDSFAATLEIGSGALSPDPSAEPVRFDDARVYLTFDPEAGRINFSEVSARTSLVSIQGAGHAYIGESPSGWPETLVGQFRVPGIALDSGNTFEGPLSLSNGIADIKLTLAPFALEIGQAVAEDEEGVRYVSGRVDFVEGEGWRTAFDLRAAQMSPERLLAYWPLRAAPRTRQWIAENVRSGKLLNIAGALRREPGQKPVSSLSYDFAGAEVRLLRDFPLATEGRGRASLVRGVYAMEIDGGQLAAPGRAPAEIGGSTFRVPDVRKKPADAEVSLRAEGPLDTILALMDNRPFRILEASGRSPDDADARLTLAADIAFPLKQGIRPEEVAFEVGGQVSDLRSDVLVPDRPIVAEVLNLAVTPEAVSVSGPAIFDGVPVDATWVRPLGGDAAPAHVSAEVPLSAETLARFGISLPPGALNGSAKGDFDLILDGDGPPPFTVRSDLRGLAVSIPALGWSKPRGAEGRLEIAGVAGAAPRLDRIVFSAPGFEAAGRYESGETPGTGRLTFERVAAGRWIDAPVTLDLNGPGRPVDIEITGGRMDLGELPAMAARSTGAGPIRVRLDSLQITEKMRLEPFVAELTTAGGLSGRFEGNANGGERLTGTIITTPNGPAVRVLSNDAGAAIRDLGLGDNGRDGTLELVLRPTSARRHYDGTLKIEDIRIRNAPMIAGLLDAVSIVGILDQLQGPGIVFDTVDARFELSPERLVLRDAAAVGASMGVSLDGVYEFGNGRTDFQGVISPVYILNAIGAVVTRPGEGLFGVSFRVTGDADSRQMSVNPLSILTPGFLRDIFRRPLPEDGD